MEEQILKLLNKNNYPFADYDDDKLCAKEITDYVMKFIGWLSFGSHPFVAWWDSEGTEIHHYYTDEITDKRWSIEELYQYWLTNIKTNDNPANY